MILIVNTTNDAAVSDRLQQVLSAQNKEFEILEAAQMKIGNCIGCNNCWLKTPGECAVKDDQETILRKMVDSHQLWIVSGTSLGFVTPLAKNIVDRLIPLATMYLKFSNKQMRHVLRYDHGYDFGLIMQDGESDADMDYLRRWADRVAINLDGKSRGVFADTDIEEAVKCM